MFSRLVLNHTHQRKQLFKGLGIKCLGAFIKCSGTFAVTLALALPSQAADPINAAELSSKPNKLNKTPAPVFAQLEAVKLVNLATGKTLLLQNITELGAFVAVAGIGNPARFFKTLQSTGITGFDTFSYPDHHKFTSADFRQFDNKAIVMTEKDAVKCTPFATDAMWYVPVDLKLPQTFIADFCAQIRKVIALYN